MKRMNYKIPLIVLISFLPTLAFAASGHHHKPHISDLLWFWFNFVAYCAILFFLLKKPISAFWKARWQGIEAQVGQAQKAFDEASKTLAEAKAKLSAVPNEIAAMEVRIKEETQQELLALDQELKDQLARMDRQFQLTKDSERKSSIELLQKKIGSQIVKSAQDQIVPYFDEDKDREYRKSALEKISVLTTRS